MNIRRWNAMHLNSIIVLLVPKRCSLLKLRYLTIKSRCYTCATVAKTLRTLIHLTNQHRDRGNERPSCVKTTGYNQPRRYVSRQHQHGDILEGHLEVHKNNAYLDNFNHTSIISDLKSFPGCASTSCFSSQQVFYVPPTTPRA